MNIQWSIILGLYFFPVDLFFKWNQVLVFWIIFLRNHFTIFKFSNSSLDILLSIISNFYNFVYYFLFYWLFILSFSFTFFGLFSFFWLFFLDRNVGVVCFIIFILLNFSFLFLQISLGFMLIYNPVQFFNFLVNYLFSEITFYLSHPLSQSPLRRNNRINESLEINIFMLNIKNDWILRGICELIEKFIILRVFCKRKYLWREGFSELKIENFPFILKVIFEFFALISFFNTSHHENMFIK